MNLLDNMHALTVLNPVKLNVYFMSICSDMYTSILKRNVNLHYTTFNLIDVYTKSYNSFFRILWNEKQNDF